MSAVFAHYVQPRRGFARSTSRSRFLYHVVCVTTCEWRIVTIVPFAILTFRIAYQLAL
jgi:hypothetical protein